MVCTLCCRHCTTDDLSSLQRYESGTIQLIGCDYTCIRWLSGSRVVRVCNELEEHLVCRVHAYVPRAEKEKKILRHLAESSCNAFPTLVEDFRLTRCVLMVYTPGVTLFRYASKFIDQEVSARNFTTFYDIIVQLLRALSHMHRRRIVHLDIKPSNILVSGDRLPVLRLIDFEFARELRGTLLNTMERSCGTVGFIAPEVYRKTVCLDSDMWSTGILTTQCLFHREVVRPEHYLNLLASPGVLRDRAVGLWARNRRHYTAVASLYDNMQEFATCCLQRQGARLSSRVGLRMLT